MIQELFDYAFEEKDFNDFCYEGGYFESKNIEYLCAYYDTPLKQDKLITRFRFMKGGYKCDMQKIIEEDFKAEFRSSACLCMKDRSFTDWKSKQGTKYCLRDGGMSGFRAYFSINKFKMIEILTENVNKLHPYVYTPSAYKRLRALLSNN
jgi:hypothetical protein